MHKIHTWWNFLRFENSASSCCCCRCVFLFLFWKNAQCNHFLIEYIFQHLLNIQLFHSLMSERVSAGDQTRANIRSRSLAVHKCFIVSQDRMHTQVINTPIRQQFCQLSGNREKNVVYYRKRIVFEWKLNFFYLKKKTSKYSVCGQNISRRRDSIRWWQHHKFSAHCAHFTMVSLYFLRVFFFLFGNYLYSVHSSYMINVTYKYDSKRALFTLLMIQMITQLPKCAVFA